VLLGKELLSSSALGICSSQLPTCKRQQVICSCTALTAVNLLLLVQAGLEEVPQRIEDP
jgi:hypothetical protein